MNLKAAEKSLDDLKALKSTSEAQIVAGEIIMPVSTVLYAHYRGDLSQRSNFVNPLLIACGTKNAKFSGIAVVCLQRLVVSRALARSSLKDVLNAFKEASGLGQSAVLRLRSYADELRHRRPT